MFALEKTPASQFIGIKNSLFEHEIENPVDLFGAIDFSEKGLIFEEESDQIDVFSILLKQSDSRG